MVLFFVGIVEMLIVTAWTRFVTKSQVLASGTITIVNILIWYYVLEKIVNDLGNIWLVLLYAFGCAIGTMLGTYYLERAEKALTARRDAKTPAKATIAPLSY